MTEMQRFRQRSSPFNRGGGSSNVLFNGSWAGSYGTDNVFTEHYGNTAIGCSRARMIKAFVPTVPYEAVRALGTD
jgi:hypothetical protein